jgi:hypothetical protein
MLPKTKLVLQVIQFFLSVSWQERIKTIIKIIKFAILPLFILYISLIRRTHPIEIIMGISSAVFTIILEYLLFPEDLSKHY